MTKNRLKELEKFCKKYKRLPKDTVPDEKSLRIWAYRNCKRPEVLKIYLQYRQLSGKISKGKSKKDYLDIPGLRNVLVHKGNIKVQLI